MDSEELIDELLPEVMDTNEDMSPLEALHKTNVCPKSLISIEVEGLVKMEAFCKNYNLPPFGSEVGYLDYPQKLVDIFSVIDNTRERMNLKLLKENQE